MVSKMLVKNQDRSMEPSCCTSSALLSFAINCPAGLRNFSGINELRQSLSGFPNFLNF